MINNCEYNMYRNNSANSFNRNNSSYYSYRYPMNNVYYQDDRNFLAPFLLGGVAGGALGYGIANNNMYKNQGGYYPGPVYFSPVPPMGVPYYYN